MVLRDLWQERLRETARAVIIEIAASPHDLGILSFARAINLKEKRVFGESAIAFPLVDTDEAAIWSGDFPAAPRARLRRTP